MKFLHYMPIKSDLYNGGTIRMINESSDFNSNEHAFFVKYPVGIEDIDNYNNVHLKPSISIADFIQFEKDYDYIILHAWSIPYTQQPFIPKKVAKKMIWCVWGHDLYKLYNAEINGGIKNRIIKFLIKTIQIPLIKNIFAICYSFPYDRKEIFKVYGSRMRAFHVSYDFGHDADTLISEAKGKRQSNNLKVMVGHSSYPFLNHIHILEKLKKYEGEALEIYLPLNYGDMVYKDKVKKYCETYPIEVHILEEKLSKEAYVSYLSNIDVAIMDFKHQAAVGNVYLLILLNKKVYANGEGIIYKGLKEAEIEIFDSRKIGEINFSEFADMTYEKGSGQKWVREMVDLKETKLRWKKLFDYCKAEEENRRI
ncbi:MAG: hypothetical protein EOM34_06805 [Clostridia bacterium]|nr:hypothetical protein [Clostridia bacterium]NCD02759.1 hypothetical protein [Clostridia bacterium]